MTIILVEKSEGGVQKPEISFSKGVILVGRDAGECDIAFEKSRWPMVSRRHAEIRYENGGWFLVDLNSTYGVFINGQKLGGPHPITAGSSIQIGMDGPTLIVIWFEAEMETLPDAAPVLAAPTPIPAAPAPIKPQIPQVSHVQRPVTEAAPQPPAQTATLEFVDSASRQPFKINSSSTWIGRDADCSIILDSFGMVSRRHAEIRLDNGGFLLEDNNSFNGTLVNEQRISAPTPLFHDDTIRVGVGGPVLRFNSPGRTAPQGADLTGQRSVALSNIGSFENGPGKAGSETMVFNSGSSEKYTPANTSTQPQLLMSVAFGEKGELTIGRDENNDIRLDGLQISKRHARLCPFGDGSVHRRP